VRLTKRAVDAAKYTGGALGSGWQRCVVWDDDLHGFGVRVYPSGRRVFVLSYRSQGRKRLATIGAYGPLTVEEARKKAASLLHDIGEGADPVAERREYRHAVTMTEFAAQYLERHARPKKRPASIAADERLLRLYVLPRWGARKVTEVERSDVARLHHDLRSTPVQANRVLALLSKMFNLAEAWSLRPDHSNPVRHVERYAERAKERFLSPAELATLGDALRAAEQDGTEDPAAILAIRLLALTGARRNEILTLPWSEVDLDRAELVLGESKTGPKRIPLPALAVALLLAAPRVQGNPYVCPGHRAGSHFVGLQRTWERVRTQAGLAGVRLHDLRHTHAATGVSAGLGLPLVGKLLGHTQAVTTQRYAHLRDDPVRAAAELVGGEIANALNGHRQPA
jgi:integrase